MARIRTIKPEFWTDAKITKLSLPARLLFIGMWNFCDDAGRHTASPRQLKSEVFPADKFSESAISMMIDELAKAGLLTLFGTHDGTGILSGGRVEAPKDQPTPRIAVFLGNSAVSRSIH